MADKNVKTFFLQAKTLDELGALINGIKPDEGSMVSQNAVFDGVNYFVMYIKTV